MLKLAANGTLATGAGAGAGEGEGEGEVTETSETVGQGGEERRQS